MFAPNNVQHLHHVNILRAAKAYLRTVTVSFKNLLQAFFDGQADEASVLQGYKSLETAYRAGMTELGLLDKCVEFNATTPAEMIEGEVEQYAFSSCPAISACNALEQNMNRELSMTMGDTRQSISWPECAAALGIVPEPVTGPYMRPAGSVGAFPGNGPFYHQQEPISSLPENKGFHADPFGPYYYRPFPQYGSPGNGAPGYLHRAPFGPSNIEYGRPVTDLRSAWAQGKQVECDAAKAVWLSNLLGNYFKALSAYYQEDSVARSAALWDLVTKAAVEVDIVLGRPRGNVQESLRDHASIILNAMDLLASFNRFAIPAERKANKSSIQVTADKEKAIKVYADKLKAAEEANGDVAYVDYFNLCVTFDQIPGPAMYFTKEIANEALDTARFLLSNPK